MSEIISPSSTGNGLKHDEYSCLDPEQRVSKYMSLLRRISVSHPDASWTNYFVNSNPSKGHSPTSILAFDNSGNMVSINSVSDDLDSIQNTVAHGSLLIVEDLYPSTIIKLGGHFNLDPAFFAQHIRDARWESDSQTTLGRPSKLISTYAESNTFHVEYVSPVVLSKRGPSNGHNLQCSANVRRKIGLTAFDNVGMVRRKISVSKPNVAIGTGWTAIMLVDPGLTTTLRHGKGMNWFNFPRVENVSHHPYQGGYVDFTPPQLEGPQLPKTSMKDDIEFYFQHRYSNGRLPSLLSGDPDLIQISYFALAIVASEWLNVVEYLQMVIGKLEFSLENSSTRAKTVSSIEERIDTLHSWRRRCSQYIRFIRETQSAITLHGCNNGSSTRHAESLFQDYEDIAKKLDGIRARIETLVTINMSAILIADAESQAANAYQSLHEAKDMKKLTNLALVFVPLTFVSGLFGMEGDVSPDGKRFWLYFAICIPLILCVFMVVYMWSGTTVTVDRFKEKVRGGENWKNVSIGV